MQVNMPRTEPVIYIWRLDNKGKPIHNVQLCPHDLFCPLLQIDRRAPSHGQLAGMAATHSQVRNQGSQIIFVEGSLEVLGLTSSLCQRLQITRTTIAHPLLHFPLAVACSSGSGRGSSLFARLRGPLYKTSSFIAVEASAQAERRRERNLTTFKWLIRHHQPRSICCYSRVCQQFRPHLETTAQPNMPTEVDIAIIKTTQLLQVLK